MDEDISIIDTKTRNEKIKSFFIENKKLLISVSLFLLLIILSFYSYQIYKDKQKSSLSNEYNNAIIEYKKGDKSKSISSMVKIVEDKDTTYSPLALYFIIDNNLIDNNDEINNLFDVLINKTSLETEIKNLIIYKKGLFNADFYNESELLETLSPLINSKSIWKSHALYLIGEYFYSKNEKKKSKEFFNLILELENANPDIRINAQKRLKRDLSE
jgi:predicted negative regulator of RcsB-dependent stress response